MLDSLLIFLGFTGVFRYMLLLKKKKYAAVTMEKKANGELVCTTELKGNNGSQMYVVGI